ncbi:hypothetical protein [Amylolactobacillus amylophilus]|uniref:hypothetical protein n=1 Tax=Amylolactobacillus amylophilus TaxID=1603 RepID=UPI0006D038E9|nr:hypothetical protein [Amylolactobacillus amylophilus]
MANYNENNRQSLNRPTTPKKRKPLDKVTDWISTNGMIILVVGLVIILLMSASRTLLGSAHRWYDSNLHHGTDPAGREGE